MRQGRKLFIRELAKQLEQFTSLMGRIALSPDDSDMLQLYRIAHTLKGSAPIFEYIRIGKLAEEIVRVWEWTQTSELDDVLINKKDEAALIQECLAASREICDQIVLESEVCELELKKEEQHNPGGGSLLGTMNSRILLVDDDEVLRSYLTRRLQLDDSQVNEAADVESAKRMLREHTYDIVILDLMMSPHSGFELFEFLKEDPTLKWLPLIVLSGRNDVSDKVKCFKLGADDYVTKPFQYDELAARIYSILKRTKNFEQLAFRDALTGVFNRRYFDLQIGIELQRTQRYDVPISLAFIDIDKFKSINDTYGHPIGDLVLQGLAHVLQKNLRSTDLLARFGGEEFVIALPNTPLEQAKQVLENVLQVVREKPVAKNDGQAFSITFSAGLAQWQPGQPVDEWLNTADHAMYQAKQGGRNRIAVAQAPDSSSPQTTTQSAAEHFSKKKLLIVDDDHILRSILLSHLEHLPIEIMQASDGAEALQLLVDSSFDACILDGMMPNMDGFHLLDRIKGSPEIAVRETKVLMLSGKKKSDDLLRGYRMGADDYMTKPFSLVELEMRVRRLMQLDE
ncbi:GGDEF domain-containing response regulator [Paenibacillus hexagrammi]|uniref:Response regulator n=1 Tax=Paenibacillus hexagrammi TaxID=2908839 RepID=A0ABY3SLM8_9BACL|nr:response regulator [Paenibacillus sp. YPD9-1]UJF34445.1 response regulator [Paenibacillus sp. YPD9-1]